MGFTTWQEAGASESRDGWLDSLRELGGAGPRPVFRQTKAALSLMEVVFALGMISTVLVIVFTVLVGGLRLQERAEVVEQASSLLREQVEEIKSHAFSIEDGTYDGLAGDPPSNGFPPPPYPSAVRGGQIWLQVVVEATDERVWYLKVTAVNEGGRSITSVETLLLR